MSTVNRRRDKAILATFDYIYLYHIFTLATFLATLPLGLATLPTLPTSLRLKGVALLGKKKTTKRGHLSLLPIFDFGRLKRAAVGCGSTRHYGRIGGPASRSYPTQRSLRRNSFPALSSGSNSFRT